MNRRSMLGVLGLGAAAGPVVAKEMIYQTGGLSTPAIVATQDWKEPGDIPWNPVEQLAQVKKEYEAMTSDSSAWIADFVTREYEEYLSGYASYRLETIDPDIRNMKSLSESAKMRMYFTRKAKRRYESISGNLLNRIQQLIKEI